MHSGKANIYLAKKEREFKKMDNWLYGIATAVYLYFSVSH